MALAEHAMGLAAGPPSFQRTTRGWMSITTVDGEEGRKKVGRAQAPARAGEFAVTRTHLPPINHRLGCHYC